MIKPITMTTVTTPISVHFVFAVCAIAHLYIYFIKSVFIEIHFLSTLFLCGFLCAIAELLHRMLLRQSITVLEQFVAQTAILISGFITTTLLQFRNDITDKILM